VPVIQLDQLVKVAIFTLVSVTVSQVLVEDSVINVRRTIGVTPMWSVFLATVTQVEWIQ